MNNLQIGDIVYDGKSSYTIRQLLPNLIVASGTINITLIGLNEKWMDINDPTKNIEFIKMIIYYLLILYIYRHYSIIYQLMDI